MEEENVLEPPFNDSFKISSSPLSNSASLVSATGAGSPSLTSTTFEGINSSSTPFVPPDVSLAVGVRRVIQMVNGLFQVYDKVGDKLLPDRDQFSSVQCIVSDRLPDPVDPNIIFDPVSKRFFASVFDLASSSIRRCSFQARRCCQHHILIPVFGRSLTFQLVTVLISRGSALI